MYEVIIVGGGPAGLTTALYTARRTLKTLILTKDLGGQTILALNIENYPGAIDLSGIELMEKFKQQAESFGAEIKFDLVKDIKKQDNVFEVLTESGQVYKSKAIVLAFGRVPKKLNVKGEKEFLNKGVAYCATCDAPLFAEKDVVVVGGGSAAADAALLLSKIANKVYLVHRRNQFRAEDILIKRMQEDSDIEFMLNSTIEEIKGTNFVEKVVVKNTKTQKISEINAQGVFVEVGFEVKTDFIKMLIKLNESGEVIIDEFNQTSLPGMFAAGDITTVPYKQTIISAGEGAKAGLSVYNYLNDIPIDMLTEDYNRNSS